jgi:hypothetical protein
MRACKGIVVVAGLYVATSVGLRLFTRAANRLAHWRRLHARVDGVTAVSAAYLGLPGDRTPYPAPWTDTDWDQPGWYGERPDSSYYMDEKGTLFIGPNAWFNHPRSKPGAGNPEAN